MAGALDLWNPPQEYLQDIFGCWISVVLFRGFVNVNYRLTLLSVGTYHLDTLAGQTWNENLTVHGQFLGMHNVSDDKIAS